MGIAECGFVQVEPCETKNLNKHARYFSPFLSAFLAFCAVHAFCGSCPFPGRHFNRRARIDRKEGSCSGLYHSLEMHQNFTRFGIIKGKGKL
jgi:hypothetical protein